jgi:hypothetical protein
MCDTVSASALLFVGRATKLCRRFLCLRFRGRLVVMLLLLFDKRKTTAEFGAEVRGIGGDADGFSGLASQPVIDFIRGCDYQLALTCDGHARLSPTLRRGNRQAEKCGNLFPAFQRGRMIGGRMVRFRRALGGHTCSLMRVDFVGLKKSFR